jgi:hypothetical protein
MYPNDTDEMILRLEEIIQKWENTRSYTGDVSRDIGIEEAYQECVDELKELLGIEK